MWFAWRQFLVVDKCLSVSKILPLMNDAHWSLGTGVLTKGAFFGSCVKDCEWFPIKYESEFRLRLPIDELRVAPNVELDLGAQ